MKQHKKLIVIVGQTATGKSLFAVQLAKKINGEIISADSRQIYKGLDLLSGKVTKKEMGGIPHHMLDILTPRSVFSVAQYQKKAYKIIDGVLKRKRVPILVGGTGLYIDSVTLGNILPEVPPNKKLRKQLTKYSTPKLFEILKKVDPLRAETIDKNNPVRLIRAIEIAKALGVVPMVSTQPKYEVLSIGLTLPEEKLKNTITKRIEDRIKKGMLREAKKLHTRGITYKRMGELGLECRYASLYLQNKITKKEFMSELAKTTWQYAKRQKTWFKRNPKTIWVDPQERISNIQVKKLALNFLSKDFSI